jgi:hypothetical protein
MRSVALHRAVEFGARHLWNMLAWLGAVLFLLGTGPMFAALVIDNRAIDDGPDPGDQQIMAEWDAWAFSPLFIACAAIGLALLLARLAQHLTAAFRRG